MDNTEGSRVITQIYRVRKNLQLCVSDRQIAILLGSILGDSYIYPQGKICFEHSEKQKSYLLWKYEELKTLAYPKVAQVIRLDKRHSTSTVSWRFFLRQYFRPLRTAFYANYWKVVPKDLNRWMTPLLLAVWYMDDGYLAKGNPLLMTNCFSFEDSQYLASLLQEKLNIKCFVNNQKQIRIQHGSSLKFFELINPFIQKDLRYKLPWPCND